MFATVAFAKNTTAALMARFQAVVFELAEKAGGGHGPGSTERKGLFG